MQEEKETFSAGFYIHKSTAFLYFLKIVMKLNLFCALMLVLLLSIFSSTFVLDEKPGIKNFANQLLKVAERFVFFKSGSYCLYN